jgi:PRTRC genetic system protein B
LKRALLIYEDQISKRDQFASVHDVLRAESEPSEPFLGPGKLLTVAFLEQLCRGLERKSRASILPENVFAYTSDLLVWWTPQRLHPMFFSDGAEDRHAINGRICPHPALVWSVKQGRLSLRALVESTRPTAATQLMIAPYWNTNPVRGTFAKVTCGGHARRIWATCSNGKKGSSIAVSPIPVAWED